MKSNLFSTSIISLIIIYLISACQISPTATIQGNLSTQTETIPPPESLLFAATPGNRKNTAVTTPIFHSSKLEAAYLEFGELSDGFYIGGVDKPFGSLANMTLNITPATFIRNPDADDWLLERERDATNSNLAEIRYCLSTGDPCTLRDKWEPINKYSPLDQLPYKIINKIVVDWEGMHVVRMKIQLRDKDKNTVLGGIYQDGGFVFSEIVELTCKVYGRKPTPSPNVARTQTSAAATLSVLPVRGSIRFERNRMGAQEGSTITAVAFFEATSPYGKVTEMRETGMIYNDEAEIKAPWEPFVSRKEYQVQVIINWTTFYRCVEFRDEKGNRSPVYCADVAVEGSPKPPE